MRKASLEKLLRISEREGQQPTTADARFEVITESLIEPEIQICDSHHHLWYLAAGGYSLEDFQQDISGGHNIVHTVFIESRKMLRTKGPPEMQPVGETEFIYELVTSSTKKQSGDRGIAAGIVGFADLTLGEAVIPVLEAHIATGRDRFKGVRFTTTWDASPDIKSSSLRGTMASPQFRKGFAVLSRYNLSFDAWQYYPQLSELEDLAHVFPQTRIVICHTGGPLGIGPYAARRKAVFQEWGKNMAALAEYDNVYVKLGGLGMDICGFGWSKRRLQPPVSTELAKRFAPYFLSCIERFGVNRCMFESNFPVDKKAYSYTVLWNAFKRIVADFSKNEKQALFHDTAAKFYHLPRAIY